MRIYFVAFLMPLSICVDNGFYPFPGRQNFSLVQIGGKQKCRCYFQPCRPRPWIFFFAESVEKDQPAHTCRLILLCTFRSPVTNFCRRNLIYNHLTNFIVFVTSPAIYPFPKQALVLTCLQHNSFENTVGKGENCS